MCSLECLVCAPTFTPRCEDLGLRTATMAILLNGDHDTVMTRTSKEQ